jgi:ABC-type hemin transport system substrate-binding protein
LGVTREVQIRLRRWLLLGAAALLAGLSILIWASADRSRPWTPPSTDARPRIVALSPAIAVLLRDLGVADRIVGRHAYDLVLGKSIPVCGEQSAIDYEALLATHPTHVLIERPEVPPRLRDLAVEHHWTVENFRLLTLEDIRKATDWMAERFAPGPAAAALRQRMQALWETPHPPIAAGRILLLETIDPPGALGPGSAHDQILRRLGASPAIEQGKPYMTLDAEEVLRLAPDGIIIFAARDPGSPARPPAPAEQVKARLGRLGQLEIPANRAGRLAIIDDPLCVIPSTAFLDLTEEMDAILKAWASKP